MQKDERCAAACVDELLLLLSMVNVVRFWLSPPTKQQQQQRRVLKGLASLVSPFIRPSYHLRPSLKNSKICFEFCLNFEFCGQLKST
jgi:hypothetical protein